MKSFFFNAILFLGVLLIMFCLGEFGVRILYKDSTSMFPRYHTNAKYGEFEIRKIRPNSKFRHTSIDGSWNFVTNKQGFRNDKDFEYDKPEDLIRVVAIGDSHTQGYEVHQDYTFSKVIEKYLKKKGHHVEVFNTGVSGFSNAEELVLLENELVKYHPDFVVLGFFANDFEDNIKAGIFELDEKGRLRTKKYSHLPGVSIQNFIYSIPGIKFLSENSHFYSLFFNRAWAYAKLKLKRKSQKHVFEQAVATKAVRNFKFRQNWGLISSREYLLPISQFQVRGRSCFQISPLLYGLI